MPREDVPYPDECSEKCNAWKEWIENLIATKLATVNGISGDAAANLQLISGGNIEINPISGKSQIELKVPNIVDADYAEEAGHAEKADLATEAVHAVEADHAATASTATKASGASKADSADYATEAGEARYAVRIGTHAESDLVDIAGEQTVTGAKTINTLKTPSASGALTTEQVINSADINTPAGANNNLVHRTGTEEIQGAKTFNSIKYPSYGLNAVFTGVYAGSAPSTSQWKVPLRFLDENSVEIGLLQLVHYADGKRELRLGLKAQNLKVVHVTILKIDAEGNII